MPENIPIVPVTVERIEPPVPELPKEIVLFWNNYHGTWGACVDGSSPRELKQVSENREYFHILRLPAAGEETKEQRMLRKLREWLENWNYNNPIHLEPSDVIDQMDQLEAEEKDDDV